MQGVQMAIDFPQDVSASSGKCRVCGRALSAEASIAAGIGPICAGHSRAGSGEGNMSNENGRVLPPYTLIRFKGENGRAIECGVLVNVPRAFSGDATACAAVVLAEPIGYTGMSVTNAAGEIASEVVRRFDLDPERCVWIEHYSGAIEGREGRESFAALSFADWRDGRAVGASWAHLDRAQAVALYGRDIPAVG